MTITETARPIFILGPIGSRVTDSAATNEVALLSSRLRTQFIDRPSNKMRAVRKRLSVMLSLVATALMTDYTGKDIEGEYTQ